MHTRRNRCVAYCFTAESIFIQHSPLIKKQAQQISTHMQSLKDLTELAGSNKTRTLNIKAFAVAENGPVVSLVSCLRVMTTHHHTKFGCI